MANVKSKSPVESARLWGLKDIFVINDIDLVVPPQHIAVQKEDLVYHWKTLRTKTSTKIPTGRGQVHIAVTIPFTERSMLSLHRLIVQFKHSPFCFIENRYLRESLVPHWPDHQNMAFTMTSLNVTLLDGSSDTWVAQLDLMWFEYSPYAHNWLYREDWITNPIHSAEGGSLDRPRQYTIGWDIDRDTYKTTPRNVEVFQNKSATRDTKTKANGWVPGIGNDMLESGKINPNVSDWSVVTESYKSMQKRTVYDMEIAHDGIIFDLLPMPDNMAPSAFVGDPRNSLIYTRYINYLQRDALLKNFGVDIEKLLLNLPDTFGASSKFEKDRVFDSSAIETDGSGIGNLYPFFANTFTDLGVPTVHGLHTSKLPERIRRKIASSMLVHNHSVQFYFHAITEVEFPKRWTEYLQGKYNDVARTAVPRSPVENVRTKDVPHQEWGGGEEHKWEEAKKLQSLEPEFAGHVQVIMGAMRERGYNPRLFYAWRSLATQAVIKARGDSLVDFSFHNAVDDRGVPAALSADIVDDKLLWGNPDFFRALGQEANKLDLEWGGDWNNFKDYSHVQFVDNDQLPAVEKAGRLALATFGLSSASVDTEDTSVVDLFGESDDPFLDIFGESLLLDPDDDTVLRTEDILGDSVLMSIGDGDRLEETVPAEDDEISSEDIDALAELMEALAADGWVYYDKDPTVTNIWEKAIVLNIRHSGLSEATGFSELPEVLKKKGVLLTGVSGALSHVVASLPILSREYPTHQHLGSIEPMYNMEFAFLDDSEVRALEGIPIMAKYIQAMVALLQRNSRSFRPVLDSWCVSTDTFITRLLGTHYENDISSLESDTGQRVVDIRKRTTIARTFSSVVEKHPGLSTFSMEVQETNPYIEENIISNSKSLTDKEDARKQILKAVQTLDFIDELKAINLPFLIAAAAERGSPHVLDLDSSELGQFKLSTYEGPLGLIPQTLLQNDAFIYVDTETGKEYLMLRSHGQLSPTLSDMLGIDQDIETIRIDPRQGIEGRTLRSIRDSLRDGSVQQGVLDQIISVFDSTDSVGERAKALGLLYGADVATDIRSAVLGYVTAVPDLTGQLLAYTGFLSEDYAAALTESLENLNSVHSDFSADVREGIQNDLQDRSGDFYKIELTDTGLQNYATGGSSFLPPYDIALTTVQAQTFDIGIYTYNIRSFLDQHPELADIDLDTIIEYNYAVHEIIATANRMLAEPTSKGVSEEEINKALYDLGVQADMWKSWQVYLEEFVRDEGWGLSSRRDGLAYSGAAAIKVLFAAENYPAPGDNTQFKWQEDQSGDGGYINASEHTGWQNRNTISKREKDRIRKINDKFFGYVGTPTAALHQMMDAPFSYGMTAANDFLGSYVDDDGKLQSAIEGMSYGALAKSNHSTALYYLVDRYLGDLPMRIYLPDRVKSNYEFYFGNIFGTTFEEGSTLKSMSSLRQQLFENIFSHGNFRSQMVVNLPLYDSDHAAHTRFGYAETEAPGVFERSWRELGTITVAETMQESVFGSTIAQTILNPWVANLGEGGGLGERAVAGEELFRENRVQVGRPFNSAFEHPVNTNHETEKIRYIKEILAAMADDLLAQPRVLRAFGLDELALEDKADIIAGTECYPDLDLPFHPYYNDKFSVSPDFYMWNIYEDGRILDFEQQDQIYKSMEIAVQSSYDAMQRLQGKTDGEDKILNPDRYDSQRDLAIGVPSTDDIITTTMNIFPEGSNSNSDGFGPMGSTFYPTKGAKAGTEAFLKKAEKAGYDAGVFDGHQGRQIKQIKLGASEGYMGEMAGIQYPGRLAFYQYEQVKGELDRAETMFGDQAGFLNEHLNEENSPEIDSRSRGTNYEKPPEIGHLFDSDSLKKLARDSSKDLLSRKVSMRRAYPTFKLFFVEEDERESRFLNFDDFYTYNAVKDFTIVKSRKIAADHAVITLQNVAGTLDGTRRAVISDLDYFSRIAEDKLGERQDTTSSYLSGDVVTRDTTADQPFGAVILRPGLNVQLRAGYSNDPDNLSVMLNGRVVDLVWNKTGDIAEITVQSFGTELVQQIKGTARDQSSTVFQTTHALLGSMILEPEVMHFGRWEIGQLYQRGEQKSHKLDFIDYSKQGFMGRWKTTNYLTKAIVNNPGLIFVAMLGYEALGFLPVGKLGKVGRFLSKFSPKRFLPAADQKAVRRGFDMATKLKSGTDEALSVAFGRRLVRSVRRVTEPSRRLLNPSGLSDARRGLLASDRAKVFKRSLEELTELSKKGGPVDSDVLEALYKRTIEGVEAVYQRTHAKNIWFPVPTRAGDNAARGLNGITKSIFGNSFGVAKGLGAKALFGGGAIVAGGAALGAIIDLTLVPAYDTLVKSKITSLQQYFTRTKTNLFLSPQDDNLFPPHPKDYMRFRTGLKGKFDSLMEAIITTGSRTFAVADTGNDALAYIYPDYALSKKADPVAYEYVLTSTTIWSVFHEMSLRHPGWIYGAKPYGTKLRYTMFFGIPAQRYWARPGGNRFVERINRLRKALEPNGEGDSGISDLEFIDLYGRTVAEKIDLELEAQTDIAVATESEMMRNNIGPGIPPYTGPDSQKQLVRSLESHLIRHKRITKTNIAIKEYLRGLELRFIPFRKYHMFSSERDIIWNGIMGSENAVSNAVDVTYFAEADAQTDDFSEQTKTSVFKAHAFIPENMLRMKAVRWPNTKGYQMAMRYGMGELMYSMKDMYRGELVLLGNARIDPWDVGILMDSYNDMVGPIEVEQVVHTMSHETGFITEVKPSAFVIGNEISGWPLITAMKIFALAVKDIEDRSTGVRTNSKENPDDHHELGNLRNIADFVTRFGGNQPDNVFAKKYKEIFGSDGASLDNDAFGGQTQEALEGEFEAVRHISNRIESAGQAAQLTGLALQATGLAGISASFLFGGEIGNVKLSSGVAGAITAGPLAKKIYTPKAWALAAGGAVALSGFGISSLGAGAVVASQTLNFPSLAWLVGGPIMMLQCLRNETIIIVPLMKNGFPIISGLAYNDPNLIWNNFRGNLNRMVHDTIEGTADMLLMGSRYGSALWNQFDNPELEDMTGMSLPSPGI